jgi:hypothetical protein
MRRYTKTPPRKIGGDSTTVEVQLEFIAYELLNSFQAVAVFLKRAKTVTREEVQPYVGRLAPR